MLQPPPPIFKRARRRWLKQTGVLAASAALPLWIPGSLAQSGSSLSVLPRVALVIGNSKYPEAPLKNPGNDAKGIANELQKLGFQVNLKLDAGRNEMLDAIRAFGGELAKKKGVGMFYYAGHGAQLAWKNYLIPVDALIDRIEDMQSKTVELNALLEGIVKAQNPMNVIILDACRDNPFGNKAQIQQKGLSQFDAPPGSLLAYATSPGNTAADGEGANGFYTENLLRELAVPQAKIEDVFKRVRLAVRRRSQGLQIPWESTSLEDDFYFIPPAQIRKLSEAELEKAFEEELAIWDKIKTAKEPEPLVAYLEKYPSGKFSELAQFRLDRLLAEIETKRTGAAAAARKAEQERLAQRAEEEKQARLAEEKRSAEEKRLVEERKLTEEKRIATEKRFVEERRVAEQKRLADEQRIAKLAKEKRAAEEARVAEERNLAEERRAAEEKRLAEEKKLAEEQARAGEQRLAEERRQAKIGDEQRSRSQARVEPAKIIPVGPNPYSKGMLRMDVDYRIGDSFSYREFDMLTKIETRAFTQKIAQITEDEVIYNGVLITDLLGNVIRNRFGHYTGYQQFIPEYQIGKKWTTRFKLILTNGTVSDSYYDFKVVDYEKVTVPAGTFEAFRVEGEGWGNGSFGSVSLKGKYWIAAGIRRPIAGEFYRRHSQGKILNNERLELTAYAQR